MNLEEINSRLKRPITQDQLDEVHPLYCVLNLSKDYFAAIVEAVGIVDLAALGWRWKRLSAAEIEYRAGERYIKNLELREQLDEKLSIIDDELGRYELARQHKGFPLYSQSSRKGGEKNET